MRAEVEFQKNFREWLIDKPQLYKEACQHFNVPKGCVIAAYKGTWEDMLKYFQEKGWISLYLNETCANKK